MATAATEQPSPTPSQQPDPRLPAPFSRTPTALTLLTQGAEALVYRTSFLTPTTECALKIRPAKPWRHPLLDRRLTRARVLAETRVLLKCAKEKLAVPAVLGASWEEGWVALEWVRGVRVKEVVFAWREGVGRGNDAGEKEEGELKGLMRRIGRAVGRLHNVGVVHGDLTTSNMILRPEADEGGEGEEGKEGSLAGEIVLIDFGLAQQTVQEEDRAVDLYVLERAFGSTHPREEGFFGEVLEGYREAYKGSKGALRKLEDVRMRGRKKSMIG